MNKSSVADDMGGAGDPPSTFGPTTKGSRLDHLRISAFITALLATSIFLTIVVVNHSHQQAQTSNIRVSGIPSTVSTLLANLMSLSPVPHRLAPDFLLTDQFGGTVSLHSFRGRSVVLEFMDPHCVDICPLVSREFVNAYHDLGAASTHVAFLAVNVNQYFASVANVAAYSNAHQLDSIPSWHFLTGTFVALRAVWRNYGVAVEAPNPRADIVHTSIIYFIDSNGHERYIAVPQADHSSKRTAFLPPESLVAWGRGIAKVVKSMSN